MPAMPFHDLPHQVEADPGTGDVLELRVVNPVKLLEQMPARAIRDPNSVIPDHEADSAILAVTDHLDLGWPTTELNGVLEQVVQGYAEPFGIAEHWQACVGQIELKPTRFELDLRLHPIDRFGDHRA